MSCSPVPVRSLIEQEPYHLKIPIPSSDVKGRGTVTFPDFIWISSGFEEEPNAFHGVMSGGNMEGCPEPTILQVGILWSLQTDFD
mmetsp:Transcript_62419/g.116784  ORF Transcript_62419/g.116784 Transcript_62419/m.116784 type:complete len:85 (-) Transcript_62419:45-299(-)